MEKAATSRPERDLQSALGSGTVNSGMRAKGQGRRRLGRGIAFGAVVCLLLCGPGSLGQRRGGGGGRGGGGMRGGAARMAPARPNQGARADRGGNQNGVGRPGGQAEMRPGANGRGQLGLRPGQEHLQQWLAQHPTFQQQENSLRREPGFNRLSPEQQQRVMNRLRTLDARPAEQRQRTLARQEMFERLSPEQKQDVRGAAQSLAMMAPDRQRMVRRAFNDLRQIPPEQRTEILNSARFDHTFSPQERHVLGSLLSIEPYQGK